MSLLYGAFFQISNSSLQVKSTLETRQELRLLMKMVLDDLQNVQFLKHFAESGQSTNQQRESGMIAEIKLGPENPETGGLEEVSSLYFHTAAKSRFYPEEKEQDPELHEVSYTMQENLDTKTWEFVRREDFYLDNNLREGGKSYVLSETVTKFELLLLERETRLAGGGNQEEWTREWDSDEENCGTSRGDPFCLPRAVKLTMALKDERGNTVTDSQVHNLCVPPCNPEIFY